MPDDDNSSIQPDMNATHWRTTLWRVIFLAWLGVTLAAVFGMYRLWTTREYRLYAGRSVADQRTAMFRHVGFAAYLLRDAEAIAGSLPPDTDYHPVGDFNRLSYVQYLLIPRIPMPDAAIALRDTGASLVLDPPQPQGATRPPSRTERPRLHALLLAVGLVIGFGLGLRCLIPTAVSLPQACQLAILFGMGFVTLSRAWFYTAVPGFVLWAAAGVGGACLVGLRRRRVPPPARQFLCRAIATPAVAALLAVAGAFLIWSLLMAVVVVPDDWDAWAMWGAKAKVLALGEGPLEEVTRFGSPEYPLLWPCLWAFTGWLAGGWEECWAKGWGAVLLGLTAWQIVLHLRGGSSLSHVAPAVILPAVVFVAMPFVSLSASWAYAEPAYWLSLACAWSALTALRKRSCGWTAAIAGLLLAAAMHTKNEGAVFAAIAGAWLLPQREVRLVHKLTVYAIAALAFLPWLAWTRLLHGLDTTSTGGFVTLADAVQRLGTSGVATVTHMLRIALDPRLWGLGLAGVGGIAAYALLKGKPKERAAIFVVAALFIAYAAVLSLGQNDPLRQVGMAWSRLVTHLALLTIMVAGHRLQNTSTGAGAGQPPSGLAHHGVDPVTAAKERGEKCLV